MYSRVQSLLYPTVAHTRVLPPGARGRQSGEDVRPICTGGRGGGGWEGPRSHARARGAGRQQGVQGRAPRGACPCAPSPLRPTHLLPDQRGPLGSAISTRARHVASRVTSRVTPPGLFPLERVRRARAPRAPRRAGRFRPRPAWFDQFVGFDQFGTSPAPFAPLSFSLRVPLPYRPRHAPCAAIPRLLRVDAGRRTVVTAHFPGAQIPPTPAPAPPLVPRLSHVLKCWEVRRKMRAVESTHPQSEMRTEPDGGFGGERATSPDQYGVRDAACPISTG